MEAPTPSEETAAIEWLKSLNVTAPEKSQVELTLRNWRVWTTTTKQARTANLALELSKISPKSNAPVFSLNAREDLKALSAANLERLKAKLNEHYPATTPPDPLIQAQIREMSESIQFQYLSRRYANKETGMSPPLVSPRELAKFDLNFAPGYYSKLVGDSPSVAFNLVVTKKDTAPFSLNTQITHDAYRLNDTLAAEEGFFVPNFSNVLSLLRFFADWEPDLLDQVFKQSRLSLPLEIDTLEKFWSYLEPTRVKQVFPDTRAYEQLATLREHLHRFVLTQSDLRLFVLWAFERYATLVSADQDDFNRLRHEFSLTAGVQKVMAVNFKEFLGMGDLVLRVPLAVGPQSYTILRVEERAYSPSLDRNFTPQSPRDSRRLDHDSKP